MENKNVKNMGKKFQISALEEMCKISSEELAKKVFHTQYDRVINEISYILKNGKAEMLSYAYKLNCLEMSDILMDNLSHMFHKGLGKIDYSKFDIDFNDKSQVNLGIYGYTVGHVYKLIKDENKK